MLNPDQLAVRVLNVDSRTRMRGRAEDATIVLPDPLELPDGACCWVTGWNLPLVWPNGAGWLQMQLGASSAESDMLAEVLVLWYA